MKKVSLFIVALIIITSCTTVRVTEQPPIGEVAHVEIVNEYGSRYKATVWDSARRKYVVIYTNTLYSIGDPIILGY